MQFTLQCFFLGFFIQSAEQTRTKVFFTPSLLQDRCERSGAALPASLLSNHTQHRPATSVRLFKGKLLHWCVAPGLLFWRSPGGRVTVFLGALTHHLHPLEEQTQWHQQQRHRTEEAAHRDTPRSGWRRQLHTG